MPPETGTTTVYRWKDAAEAPKDDSFEERPKSRSPLDKKYHQERSALITWDKGSVSLKGMVDILRGMAYFAAAGLLLENINKIGIRPSLERWIQYSDARQNIPGFHPALLMLLGVPVPMLLAYSIEKAMALSRISERIGLRIHVVNLLLQYAYPVVGIWTAGDTMSIVGACSLTMTSVVMFLKVWSFVHTSCWARDKRRELQINVGDGKRTESHTADATTKETVYPDNLTVPNLVLFTFAPTLCYELDYPRKARTNWRVVMEEVMALVIVGSVAAFFLDQFLAPPINAIMVHIERNEWSIILQRTLQKTVPLFLTFWCLFYIMFHITIKICGELTRFGDTHAYDPWWDATDMYQFWRRWNTPVHTWCVRHVYLPLRSLGLPKNAAVYAVFAFSGIMHEYVVAVPLRSSRFYLFPVFLLQAPLCAFTEWLTKTCGVRWGQFGVWVQFYVFTPILLHLYFHHYNIVHNGPEGINALEHFVQL